MHDIVRRSTTTALLFTLAASAHAASFDCKAAKTPSEKAICASPRLSTLDEQLAREYERALHALSPAGAARLKESQRSWLRFATAVCVPRKSIEHGESPASCLEAQIGQRLQQLAQAGVRLGPYVFNRIDSYAVSRSHDGDDAGYNHGFVTRHVGYPAIDSPTTAAATAWNAQQPQEPASVDAEDDTDQDIDVTLGCVGAAFISVEEISSEYAHGSPHGVFDREKRNELLTPTLRDMTEHDVFAEESGWEEKLPALFWNVYVSRDRRNEDRPDVEKAIRGSAADPGSWLLTPAGLQISFGAYEAGCYACNPGPITVPWSSLKPMLKSPELASCKAPPAARP